MARMKNRMCKVQTGLWMGACLWSIAAMAIPPASDKRYEPYFAFGFNPEFVISATSEEKGTAKAYLTDDFSLYRSYELKEPSADHKQVIWDSATENPFKKAYPKIYTEAVAEALQQCSYWGEVPVDLDDNRQTREWFITASHVLCMPDDYQHVFKFDDVSKDKIPHTWLLQQAADDSFRILVEGDGAMLVNHEPASKGYREVVSMLKDQPQAKSIYSCGETELRWRYRDNHYEPVKVNSTAAGCKEAHDYGGYEQFTGDKEMTQAAARSASIEIRASDEQYLPEIREKAQDFVDSLGFSNIEATSEAAEPAANVATPEVSNRQAAPQPLVAPRQTPPQPAEKSGVRSAPPVTIPKKDDFDLEKLLRSGALDELLKP